MDLQLQNHTINGYDFRIVLKGLYKSALDIDTDTDMGWYNRVGKMLFDKGIISYTHFEGVYKTKSGTVYRSDEQAHKKEYQGVGAVLLRHVSEDKFKEVSNLQTKYLYIYALLFGCSVDYLLGLSSAPVHTDTDLPISLKTLNTLRVFKKHDTEYRMKADLVQVISGQKEGFKVSKLVPTLEYLINNPSLSRFLYTFIRYALPFRTVVVSPNKNGKMVKAKEDKLYLASEKNVNDYRSIDIDATTLKAITKNELSVLLEDFAKEYRDNQV